VFRHTREFRLVWVAIVIAAGLILSAACGTGDTSAGANQSELNGSWGLVGLALVAEVPTIFEFETSSPTRTISIEGDKLSGSIACGDFSAALEYRAPQLELTEMFRSTSADDVSSPCDWEAWQELLAETQTVSFESDGRMVWESTKSRLTFAPLSS